MLKKYHKLQPKPKTSDELKSSYRPSGIERVASSLGTSSCFAASLNQRGHKGQVEHRPVVFEVINVKRRLL